MSWKNLFLPVVCLIFALIPTGARAETDKEIAQLDAQIAKKPTDPAGYAARGFYREFKDFSAFIRDLEKAAALHSNNPRVYLALGNKKLAEQDITGALADFDRALQLSPDRWNLLLARGNARMANKDYDGAISDYHRVLNDFDFARMLKGFAGGDIHYHLGLAEERKGDIKAAIKDLTRASEYNVSRVGDFTYYSNGPAYYELQVLKHPNDPKAWDERGGWLAHKYDYEAAESDFDKAIALSPQFGDAYLHRGTAKLCLGSVSQSISDFDRALALEPQNEKVLEMRGIAKLAQENAVSALGDFSRGITLNSHYPNGYFFQGIAYECRGEFAAARDSYLARLDHDRTQSDSVRIQLTLVLRRLHGDESQAGLLPLVHDGPVSWRRNIGLYVLGQLDDATFFNIAKGGEPDEVRVKECQALYYAGMEHLFRGDAVRAKAYFRFCAETKMYLVEQMYLAKAELARLP